MKTRRFLVLIAATVAACKSGNSGHHISGVAHVVHGASAPASFRAQFAPSNGHWLVSPDKVKARVAHISFNGLGGQGAGSDFSDCNVTFDRAAPSQASFLDCPFTLSHSASAVEMDLQMDPTSEILIDDPANGIFTDPASPTLLSATAPAAGADFVPWTATHGGTTAGALFPAALALDSADTLSVAIVMDGVQTVQILSSSGALSFDGNSTWFPVAVFPTLDAPGRTTYYSGAGLAGNMNADLNSGATMRVYYGPGANSQPLFLFSPNCSGSLTAPKGVYAADPSQSPDFSSGKAGGWLARDPSGTLCWALGSDPQYSGYVEYHTMPEVLVLGSSATESCQVTSSPTPPSSGGTYAAGCPGITPTQTTTLTLVAD